VRPPGLSLPTGIRVLAPDDFLVIEKDSGKVKRVRGDDVQDLLDLDVSNAAEQGLLGIELHPDFATNGFVYLYYSARSRRSPSSPARRWETPTTMPSSWATTTRARSTSSA